MNFASLALSKEGRLVAYSTSQGIFPETWVWQDARVIMITGYKDFFFSQTHCALFSQINPVRTRNWHF